MGIPAAIRLRYERECDRYSSLQRYIAPVLAAYCGSEHYQLMQPRIKDLDSLADKLETGKYQKWADINDLVAAAIIVPTASHEDVVLAFLRSRFTEVAVLGRRSRPMAPDHFRFDLTRWYGQVGLDEGSPDDVRDLAGLTFEVQVRTYFEHAWSVVTHDLTYKSQRIDWRQLRLAAQLKAMVEQIELTIANFEGIAAVATEAMWPETDVQRRIQELLQALLVDVDLDEMAPRSWSRASESVLRLATAALGDSGDLMGAFRLVEEFCSAVRSREFVPALSGSLVQAIYAFTATNGYDLTGFPMVDSEELHVMYRTRAKLPIDMT